MADRKFTLTFDVNANLGPIKAAADSLQKSFSGLKLPTALQSSIDKTFSKLNTEIQNFEILSSKGFSNMGDISKAERSFGKITDLLNQLKIDSNKVAGLDPEKLLPEANLKRLNQLRDAWNKFQQDTEKGISNEAEINKQTNELTKQESRVESLRTKYQALAEENKKMGTTKSGLTSSLKADEQQLEQVVQKMRELESIKGGKNTVEYKQLNQEFKNLSTSIANARKAYDSLDLKIKSNQTTMAGLNVQIKATDTSIDNIKASIDSLSQSANNIQALDNLRQTLANLKNTDISEIPTDIESLKNVINSLSASELEQVNTAINNSTQSMRSLDTATDNATQSLNSLVSQGTNLNQTANEIAQLQNQVTQFFSLGNAVQLFKRAVRSAFEDVKELDKSMTETAVVTDFSVGDMWDQLPQYTEMANELGVSILGAYDAATLYYQQGLQTNEVMAVSTETLKMARIAGMEAADATNLMTAALRGFNMEVNEVNSQRINDVYSELAAITAADTEEIGTAMSKTASIAASANMEFETTAALLSQIIETTREAPETAGTAMKTIIARFSEVKNLVDQGALTGTDEEGEVIDVNKIQTALKSVGISMNEFFAGTEGLDDILLELAEKWDTLDFTTQRYIATTAAGSRQQSRFIAMMSDYGRTQELVQAAYNSTGASQEQFEKTLDSLESKLEQLGNAWTEFTTGITNSDVIKFFVDGLTDILNIVNNLTGSLGPAGSAISRILLAFGAIKLGKNLFNKFFTSVGEAFFRGGQQAGVRFNEGLNSTIKSNNTVTKEAEKVGKQVGTKFSNSMLNFTARRKNKGIISALFGSETEEEINNLNRQVSNNLTKDMIKSKTNLNDRQIIRTVFETEGADAAIARARELGVVISDDTERAQRFATQTTLSASKVATAFGAAAMACGLISNALNEAGDTEAAETFSNIANILMVITAILPAASVAAKGLGSAFQAAGAQTLAAGLIGQMGWLWVTLIIGAIVGLIAGIVALNNAAKENSLAGQMEKAQKATAAASEAANSAKEAYDNLLNTQSEYSELQQTLDNLTKGTNEWKQALLEANAQVLELLTTYPQLAQYISRGENGQLTIEDAGFDELINQQLESMQRAQAAVVSSQMQETRISTQMAERELAEQFQLITDTALSDSGITVQSYAQSINQGYIERTGSDEGIVYDQQLIDDLRELQTVDGGLSETNAEFVALMESSGKTAEELRNLVGAINEYDLALATNQSQLEAQAASLLTAGTTQDILDSNFNESVISGFSKRMTTEDYAQMESDLADQYVREDSLNISDDEQREELLQSRGITATGDEKKDTQLLYASLAGLGTDIEKIPEDLKDNVQAMGEQIGRMLAADEQIASMEDFQKRLNQVDEDSARNIAGLMSGDASQFTKAQLNEVGNLSDYATELGYTNADEMAEALGYSNKKLSELEAEDQEAAAISLGFKVDEESELSAEEQLDNFIAQHSNEEITAQVQMDIDSEQYKAQMEDAYNKASQNLQAKGISENLYKDFSMETVSNLSEQTASMSSSAAKEYVESFNKILENSNLGESGKNQLENYLSSVDWSNMNEAIQAMDYMQSQGLDSDIIKEYWNIATDGANTYVSTLSEILSLTERLQQQLASVTDISSRLEEGTATYEDMMNLVEAGADISDFQMTSEGWKANSEQITEATDKLKEYNAEQARMMAEQQRQEFNEAKQLAARGMAPYLKTDSEGNYTSSDVSDLGEISRTHMASMLNIEAQGEEETEQQFLERLQTAYDKYISLLNNGEDIQIIADKAAAMAEAARYTAAENEARLAYGDITDNEAESIIYSAQNEATEAGIDANEMMAYATSLQQVRQGLDDVTAAQVALGNSKMNTGLSEIIDSYDEWTEVIDENTGKLKDTSSEGVATYNKLKASVNKMLNTSEDLSDAFWNNAENMKNIKKAAEGDTDALGKLQKAASKDYLLNMKIEGNITEEGIAAIDDFVNYLEGYELPTLDAGDILDDTNFIKKANEMITASNMTAEQISNAFKSMGFDVKITYQKETRNVPNEYTERVIDERDEQGYPSKWHTNTYTSGSTPITAEFPIIETLTSTGSGGGGISIGNTSAGKANKGSGGGGGGGGGSSKKENTNKWENPYDEYYNLTEQINELLRQREYLERRYDRILENRSKTAKDLYDNIQAQLASLQQEEKLQKQLLAGRQKQLRNIGSETYIDDEGNRKTYSQLGVTKYARYDMNSNRIIIDWEAINKITDEEKGAQIEDYISRLEELVDMYEETEDTLDEISDQVEELKNIGRDEYLDLEQRVYDAIVAAEQEMIDNLSETAELINESNTKLINSLQEAIDEERQARENERTEEDIQEKQRRLELLRRDTSGANALEILQLEEEISDAQESYTDSLIDQKISELQEQNDEAYEQRQEQIDLLQHLLDYNTENGEFWKDAHDLITKGIKPDGSVNVNSDMYKYLANNEGWNAMSQAQKNNWADELTKTVKQAVQFLSASRQLENIGKKSGTITFTNANGQTLKGTVNSKGQVVVTDSKGGKYTYDDVYQDYSGAYRTLESSSDASYTAPASKKPSSGAGSGKAGGYFSQVGTYAHPKRDMPAKDVKNLQRGLNAWLNSGLKVDGIYGSKTIAAVKTAQKKLGGLAVDGYWGPKTFAAFKSSPWKTYKTGGLADFTGPAWLDGTKSKPELVLNAQDTQNFIVLKDILSDILKGSEANNSENGGDNYFEIHIEVDELGNDYDVEQVADKVKRLIVDDARYRNNNAINLIR